MNNANASRHRTVGNVVDETGRRERQQAQRIAELMDRVTRLQHLVMEIANDHNNLLEDDPETLRSLTRHWARKRSFRAYEWADLDSVKGDEDATS